MYNQVNLTNSELQMKNSRNNTKKIVSNCQNHSPKKWLFLFVLMAGIIIPGASAFSECPPPGHLTTITDSYNWTTDLPFSESKAMNLVMNTAMCAGPIIGGHSDFIDPYSHNLGIDAESFVQQSAQDHSLIPADRITKSYNTITNSSDNFYFGFHFPSRISFGGPGVMDPQPPADYCGCWFYRPFSTLYGYANPGFTCTRSTSVRPRDIPDSIFQQLALVFHQECKDPMKSYGFGYDHRYGFPGNAVNSSFLFIDGHTTTNLKIHNSSYSGADPVQFTYIYTVEYCENDLILGFCPGGIRHATQTIEFGRDALPNGTNYDPGNSDIWTTNYSFIVRNSTLRVG